MHRILADNQVENLLDGSIRCSYMDRNLRILPRFRIPGLPGYIPGYTISDLLVPGINPDIHLYLFIEVSPHEQIRFAVATPYDARIIKGSVLASMMPERRTGDHISITDTAVAAVLADPEPQIDVALANDFLYMLQLPLAN